MKANEFLEKHGPASKSIEAVVNRWADKRQVDRFLNMAILPGVLVGDLLTGDVARLNDYPISPEVRAAFATLYREKVDTYDELREHILERLARGAAAERGMLNAIQGQIGEDLFVAAAGNGAQLASLRNQPAWDVSIPQGDSFQYVQVKVYEGADDVIRHIGLVKERIASGGVSGVGGETVQSVDFAVNSDIVDEVRTKVAERGLGVEIFDIGRTRSEIQSVANGGFEAAEMNPFGQFFGELFGDALSASALHAAAAAFSYYFLAKDVAVAAEDAVYGSAASSGGIAVAFGAEAALETFSFVAGPVGAILGMGAGMGTRAILRRVFDRRKVAQRIQSGNDRLMALNHAFVCKAG